MAGIGRSARLGAVALALVLALPVAGADRPGGASRPARSAAHPPAHVILVIGDGMSRPHGTFAMS